MEKSKKSRKVLKPKIASREDAVKSLLEQAEKHIDCFEYELANQFCQRSLEIDPDNVEALEMSASLLLEQGEMEQAKTCFVRAVQLRPEKGHTKYLSLAQLLEGPDSLEWYYRGIEVLRNEMESCNVDSAAADTKEKVTLRRELSNAYCSVAELFMTDLCDEPNAEERCLENIDKAVNTDVSNPEAYQCKANYLIIKNETTAAREVMQKSLSLWLPQMMDAAEGKLNDADAAEGKLDDADAAEANYPSYDARVNAAKLLIELEEFEPTVDVLEGLITEDDEVVQVWYLSGLLNYLRGNEFQANARYYLRKAQMVASKSSKTDEDPEVLAHIEEMLKGLGPDDDDVDSDDNKENANINADEDEISLQSSDDDDNNQFNS